MNSKSKIFQKYGLPSVLLILGTIVLAIVATLVAFNPHTSGQKIKSAALNSNVVANDAVNPIDQLSSTDIALTVARLNGLPETTAITNQSQSQVAESAVASATDSVIAKPQIVETSLKSRADIKQYTTKAGDTVASIASSFGISADSVRWSNNIAGDNVPVGATLAIPPMNGVVYTVKSGDTADSLASRFNSSKDQIIAYNDGEIAGLSVGQQIIIPNGSQSNGASAAATAAASGGVTFPWGGGAPLYNGANGYDYGYCTWYVAKRLPVPSNWGNANTWDNLARASGWTVSGVPRVGAVGQSNSGYYGHVAVVEAVSPDGTMIKYSDMNGLAGFNRVGYSGWVPISKFDNYIYR